MLFWRDIRRVLRESTAFSFYSALPANAQDIDTAPFLDGIEGCVFHDGLADVLAVMPCQ